MSDGAGHFDRARVQSRDLLAHGRRGVVGDAVAERAQRDGLRRQLLTHVVVKVAGDAPALFLLRGHQTPGETPYRLLALARGTRGPLALERTGKRLGQELESRSPFVRPGSVFPSGAER